MAGFLRFRRTARIAPGIRLNFSKSGVSTSFGPRGLHYTVGHGRRRSTVGLPGTGLSYTTYSSAHARRAAGGASAASRGVGVGRSAGGVGRAGGGASAAARRGGDGGAATHPAGGGALAELAEMVPPQKIAWGILLTLLVVTSPIGLWLLITGLWQLHVPIWRLRTYVRQAALEPGNASQLLDQAAAIDPTSPEVLGPLAELRSAQGDDAGALTLYRQYCQRVPSDWLARGHLALAALRCNQLDEAITEFVAIRQGAPAIDGGEASVVAHLAYAFLAKEDPQQALALVEDTARRATAADPGSQQCLFYHAVCHYMLGHTARAVQDLDRLYAINSTYEGLRAAKDAMGNQSYELLLPDGTALAPVHPGHATRSAVTVARGTPRSPHCLNCRAPLQLGALQCPYCHAQVGGGPVVGVQASVAPPSPPPPPPILG